MKKILCTIILSLFAYNTFAAYYLASDDTTTTTSHAKKWKHIKKHHCSGKPGCGGSGEYHPEKNS